MPKIVSDADRLEVTVAFRISREESAEIEAAAAGAFPDRRDARSAWLRWAIQQGLAAHRKGRRPRKERESDGGNQSVT